MKTEMQLIEQVEMQLGELAQEHGLLLEYASPDYRNERYTHSRGTTNSVTHIEQRAYCLRKSAGDNCRYDVKNGALMPAVFGNSRRKNWKTLEECHRYIVSRSLEK
jgi:hypothetical protein